MTDKELLRVYKEMNKNQLEALESLTKALTVTNETIEILLNSRTQSNAK